MTQRTINGFVYDIVSPSHWQLAGYPVEIAYLGDAWFLSLVAVEDGGETDIKMSRLASRDAGLRMIEQAFNRNMVNQ